MPDWIPDLPVIPLPEVDAETTARAHREIYAAALAGDPVALSHALLVAKLLGIPVPEITMEPAHG